MGKKVGEKDTIKQVKEFEELGAAFRSSRGNLEVIIVKAIEDAAIATGVAINKEPEWIDELVNEFISQKLDAPEKKKEQLKTKAKGDVFFKLKLAAQLIFLADPKIRVLREALGDRQLKEIIRKVASCPVIFPE